MEACSSLVRTYMVSGDENSAEQIAAGQPTPLLSMLSNPSPLGVQVGEYSLLQIVQSLGEYITEIEPEIRSKGETYLIQGDDELTLLSRTGVISRYNRSMPTKNFFRPV